jgi:hypothetical protein
LQLCYVDESGTAQTLLDTDPEPGVLRQITYDYVKGYLEFATAPRELHGLCLVALLAGRSVNCSVSVSRFRSRMTRFAGPGVLRQLKKNNHPLPSTSALGNERPKPS